jgi:hypothetical protein
MSSDPSAALKKQLYETVLLLASDEGKIEERLARAYFAHVQSMDVSALPESMQREYETIRAELQKMYPTVDATHGVDQNIAINLAMRIILIYDGMIK